MTKPLKRSDVLPAGAVRANEPTRTKRAQRRARPDPGRFA